MISTPNSNESGIPAARHGAVPVSAILDELYRQHQSRINRATNRQIDEACQRAVERISEREERISPRFGRAAA